MVVLAEHGADAAHLEHQPLDDLITPGYVEGVGLMAFSARYIIMAPVSKTARFATGPVLIHQCRDFVVRADLQNSGSNCQLS